MSALPPCASPLGMGTANGGCMLLLTAMSECVLRPFSCSAPDCTIAQAPGPGFIRALLHRRRLRVSRRRTAQLAAKASAAQRRADKAEALSSARGRRIQQGTVVLRQLQIDNVQLGTKLQEAEAKVARADVLLPRLEERRCDPGKRVGWEPVLCLRLKVMAVASSAHMQHEGSAKRRRRERCFLWAVRHMLTCTYCPLSIHQPSRPSRVVASRTGRALPRALAHLLQACLGG